MTLSEPMVRYMGCLCVCIHGVFVCMPEMSCDSFVSLLFCRRLLTLSWFFTNLVWDVLYTPEDL